MKAFVGALVASLAMVQSLPAITSDLGLSLLEYQAIIDSPLIQTEISQSEFIVEIERKTSSLDATVVKYEIETLTPSSHHHDHHKKREYIATLNLSPNPLIGPPVITVVSIVPRHH